MQTNSFLQFLQYEKRYSPETVRAYQSDLQQFGRFLLATYEISDWTAVEALHIRSWMADLINRKITARSINRKLSSLKSFYKFLLKRGAISLNPLSKIISPKAAKKLPVFISKEHMDRLFHDIHFPDDYEGCRDRFILEMLYATGMRRSELLNLKISDIDLENLRLRIFGKGGKERLAPFTRNLEKSIRQYLTKRQEMTDSADGPLLFGNNRKPASSTLIAKVVKQYVGLVSTVEKKSPHVLRHSFATHLADNGADLNAIKELLGHASLASTQVYTHNTIEKLRKIYERAHPKAK